MKTDYTIVIVEDERFSAENLSLMVKKEITQFKEIVLLDSVTSAVSWFKNNQADLAFFDVHLGDGNSFEIFDQVDVSCPIIFTTAFDQYAIKAFKVNSVDYLLKPIKDQELKDAIAKFESMYSKESAVDLRSLAKLIGNRNNFRKRFSVQAGAKITSVPIKEVAYFHVIEGETYLVRTNNHQYDIPLSLEALELELNPEDYFRINRQVIVSFNAIDQMYNASKNRIAIKLKPNKLADTVVSVRKMPEFKIWIGK